MSLTTGIIGGIITLLFGLWAIFQPVKFSRFISLTPYKNSGVSEIRATYGGWICGLAIFSLISQSDVVFYCLGSGWFGAAIIRFIALFIDKSFSQKNIKFVFGEIIVGILFFL